METINVLKGQILQSKGDINTKIYIVESGLLRSYYIDEKGKEHIFMFAPENWIITDSIVNNLPAELYIDVLENSTIKVIKKGIPNPNETKSLINRISVLQKRVIMLMSASVIERYEHFVDTYPNIVQRVPQKMIASYLGITPEALSKAKGDRIRNT